jgi:DNA-binding transcriptional ArsR family regulator
VAPPWPGGHAALYTFDVRRNRVRFRIRAADVSAIRFGVSPGHELCHAVRVLLDPSSHPLQWGWLRAVRGSLPRRSFEYLATVIGREGYFPDFLTAAPFWDMTPEEEAERLRRVPPEAVRADLTKVLARSRGRRHALVADMFAHPERTRALVSDAWTAVWEAALAPHWPQIRRLLGADIDLRVRRMGAGGVAAMVGTLHESVGWHRDAIEVGMRRHDEDVACEGSGVVLTPSVMSAPHCSVLTEPPVQPTLFYPVHGLSASWTREGTAAAQALEELLGSGRARVLLALDGPRSMSEVAGDCAMAVSTASHHLSILRRSGLVEGRREGTRVMHARTPLGEALVSGGA